jgi:hypothetical protein
MTSRHSLVSAMSERDCSPMGDDPGARSDPQTEREPTRQELIEAIRASNRHARAIRGTDADPLVRVQRALDRMEARTEVLEAERLRRARRRLLWPFG